MERAISLLAYSEVHIIIYVPVAQLDRASACGAEGRWFESSRVYQIYLLVGLEKNLNSPKPIFTPKAPLYDKIKEEAWPSG